MFLVSTTSFSGRLYHKNHWYAFLTQMTLTPANQVVKSLVNCGILTKQLYERPVPVPSLLPPQYSSKGIHVRTTSNQLFSLIILISLHPMEQPIAPRIFPLNCVVDGRWTVNNNPHRFPNVRSSDYTPVNIKDGTINIDVRRTDQNCLLPKLDTLTKVLDKNPTCPLSLTISWKAVTFLSSPSAVPLWTKPIRPDVCPGSNESLKPYLNFLTSHIHRWKAFHLCI